MWLLSTLAQVGIRISLSRLFSPITLHLACKVQSNRNFLSSEHLRKHIPYMQIRPCLLMQLHLLCLRRVHSGGQAMHIADQTGKNEVVLLAGQAH